MSREVAYDNLIMRTVAGSHLYGTNVEESDRDYLGVMIEPPEYVLGTRTFEQWVAPQSEGKNTADDVDETIYSLRKFAYLAAKGNPNLVALLFTPWTTMTHSKPAWWDLIESRDIFLSKKVATPFLGYMASQRGALLGERSPKVQRPDLVDKYGYDTKFAMHYIRLGMQGQELLRTGEMKLPLPDTSLRLQTLRGIRLGRFELQEVLKMGDFLVQQIKELETTSDLRDEPDYDKIDQLLIDMHLAHWDLKGDI